MAITAEKRKEIYELFKALGSLWGEWAGTPHEALDMIWDLHSMASTDTRYDNAYEDAKKHLTDNDDWDDDYTFLDRFHLLESSEQEFINFLNFELREDVRGSRREAERFADNLITYLPDGYSIVERIGASGKGEYMVEANNPDEAEEAYPVNIKPNTIPFFVDNIPDVYPALKLEYDNWDDFGYKTTFRLYFFDEAKFRHSIGLVKILTLKESQTQKVIPKVFTSLSAAFCSIGQIWGYYSALKRLVPEGYESVLYALKDAAWFTEIRYKFENHGTFRSSLLRNIGVNEILMGVKRRMLRSEDEGTWDFSFQTTLPYSDKKIDLSFNFGDIELETNQSRIKALIGPNGAGKTSILKKIVNSLIRDEYEDFQSSPPVFSKVIAISFSIFDTFISLHGKSSLTYTYCGLHDRYNTIMSEEDRKRRLREALAIINKDERGLEGSRHLIQRFLTALKIVFREEWIDSIWEDEGIKIEKVLNAYDTMSSGEAMMLNLVASLYAHIRNNTLIVFDELEVHLHPRAIRQMMRLLFKITREFDSACILATHSSIVVQELKADNVTIIEKDADGEPVTRVLNHESLAENLSVINSEIFGEGEIAPHYRKFIHDEAERAVDFDALLEQLASRGLPPSLPLYMLARKEFFGNS